MQRQNFSALIRGILLAIVANIVAFFLYFALLYLVSATGFVNSIPIIGDFFRNYTWLLPILLIGLSQWVYIVPIVFWLRRVGSIEVMKGVLIGAILIMLLNGGCFLLLQVGRVSS